MVRVEFASAMQSLRVLVVPKNRKRREIAPRREMSRGHDRLVLGGEVIVERNVVEIKGGKEVTVYETWPSADGQHDFQGTGRADE